MDKLFIVRPTGDTTLDTATTFTSTGDVEKFLLASNNEYDVFEASKMDVRVTKKVDFGSKATAKKTNATGRKPRMTITREVLTSIVALRDTGNMTFGQIAKKIGASESAVSARYYDERKKSRAVVS